jgi:ArsR family metal-binding transcriptional regulator
MIREINSAWDKRDEIDPSNEVMSKPKIIEILKLLPKTNCRECGSPTCMVFASLITEGAKDSSDCPQLGEENKIKLSAYIRPFQLNI